MINTEEIEISVKGQIRRAPALTIDGRTLVVKGKWVKTATVHDELYRPNGIITDPAKVLTHVRTWSARPDILQFVQRVTDPTPKFPYYFELDNLAVLPVSDYATWLAKQAKRDVKENLRRARREGVVVKVCQHDDEFVRGIKTLYDATPLRQGRPFWHYGKSFDAIKKESGHYADRSEFIGAFHGDELIGFLKMVYVGDIAKTMYVTTKESHFHRRPGNALIAKAVEVCAAKGIKYFNYGVYDYPGKKENTLTEFKKRHGFVRMEFPRYYVALTLKGRLFVALRLHRGFKRLIPTRLLVAILGLRADIHETIGRWRRHTLLGLAGRSGKGA